MSRLVTGMLPVSTGIGILQFPTVLLFPLLCLLEYYIVLDIISDMKILILSQILLETLQTATGCCVRHFHASVSVFIRIFTGVIHHFKCVTT